MRIMKQSATSTPKRAKLLMMLPSSKKGMLWMKESKANGSDKIIGNYRSNLRSIPIINFPVKTISVSLQTALAKCVLSARTRLTLDQPPTYPYIAGPLALPDPPSLGKLATLKVCCFMWVLTTLVDWPLNFHVSPTFPVYPDHQLPRHDAVPSLSRRPLLFPSRALATR